jgi:hypothetical protein
VAPSVWLPSGCRPVHIVTTKATRGPAGQQTEKIWLVKDAPDDGGREAPSPHSEEPLQSEEVVRERRDIPTLAAIANFGALPLCSTSLTKSSLKGWNKVVVEIISADDTVRTNIRWKFSLTLVSRSM